MVEIGVGCFGEFGRPSLFEFVPPPSVEGVLLVASGVMNDDCGFVVLGCWWGISGGILVVGFRC